MYSIKSEISRQRPRRPELARSLRKALSELTTDNEILRVRTLVSAVVEDAVRAHASDVHLDPVNGSYEVRFRVDGSLIDTVSVEANDGRHVLRSFKSHADLDPAFELIPQDGRAEFATGGRTHAVRVATTPSVQGEKATLRFLPDDLENLTLDQLGLSDSDHEQVTRALAPIQA